MTQPTEPLAPFLAEPSEIGQEISVTGKWVPSRPGGLFRKSIESKDMLSEWEDIHAGARADTGVLSTEINHAVGQDAVLVHHVFENPDALVEYFSTTATQHMAALTAVAKPETHLVRGRHIPGVVKEAVTAKGVPATFGELLFGYVKNDYQQPNKNSAINVTAKWTGKKDVPTALDDLKYWWQRVGTEAYSLEEGLLRFEVYRAIDEDALIIHEVFATNDDLKFHLSKGTAEKYKSDIDQVATPECYFFRGPVSWTIRTYSKFLRLPATYSSQGSNYTRSGGTMSDGTTTDEA
ncbi:MAG: antibiotic biosynthesis monooxygenase [Actinomycetia bacterium]|nr:antibiotic biosynthesis monooxygenase [Actinomycetes bacterium]